MGGLEQACAEQGAGRPPVPSLDMWANLLRVLTPAGIDRRELPAAVRLSKRAVRTRVSTAVRHRWVEEVATGRGEGIVRLTPQGCKLAARWEDLLRAAEHSWQARVGLPQAGKLRASLENLVAAFPLEHPHYPASYGPADASITGGNGVDWKPVYRTGENSTLDLPVSALVSQSLVALAMDYEELSPVAFSLSSTVIRQIATKGRRLLELGRSPGVSALIRHGFIRTSGHGGQQIAYLTHRGLDVHRAYEDRVLTVENRWRRQFGSERIAALLCALEEVQRSLRQAG